MPPTVSRIMALSLLIAVVTAASLSVNSYLSWRTEQSRELAKDHSLLTRYRQMIASEDRRRRVLENLTDRIQQQAIYLPGDKPAQAGIKLQERIKSLVRAKGGQIRTIRSLPSSTAPLREVAVDVQAKLVPSSLLGVLGELESGQPLLVVDRLQIRKEQRDDNLLVSFTIKGFLRDARS